MIKALIFDLDGTLSDSLTSIAYSANSSLRKEGLSELPRENFRYYAGDGAKELVRRYLKDTKNISCSLDPLDEANLEHFYRSYMEEFSKYCMYEVKPFPGIPELLSELQAEGIRTAVLSNKPDAQTREVVRSLFGDKLIDMVQGQTEEVPRKSAPDGALRIAAAFGLEPSECMYLGDSDTDMKTGRAAGMYTVGVLWGFRNREELLKNGAEALAEKPEDIKTLVRDQS